MFVKLMSQSSGKVYSVGETPSGWVCSCPHFTYRLSKTGTACKHIDEAKRILAEIEKNIWHIDMTVPMENIMYDIGMIKNG